VFSGIPNALIDKFAEKFAVAIAAKLEPMLDEIIKKQVDNAKNIVGDQLEKADAILDEKVDLIQSSLGDPKIVKKLLGLK